MAAPREWARDPGSYGRAAALDWIEPDSDEGRTLGPRAELVAARLQHDLMWRVSQIRSSRGLHTWTAVASGVPGLQLGEYQLRAIVRGAAPIQFQHVAALHSFFGGLILVGNAAVAAVNDARSWREHVEQRRGE